MNQNCARKRRASASASLSAEDRSSSKSLQVGGGDEELSMASRNETWDLHWARTAAMCRPGVAQVVEDGGRYLSAACKSASYTRSCLPAAAYFVAWVAVGRRGFSVACLALAFLKSCKEASACRSAASSGRGAYGLNAEGGTGART